KIRLRTCHEPVQVAGNQVCFPNPSMPGAAAILDSRAPALFHLNLQLQREVFGLEAGIRNISVADGGLLTRFPHDGTILNAPKLWIPVPSVESFAIEKRNITFMLVEIKWVGLEKLDSRVI